MVPAKHRGDLGIEAYTYSGCAFQCYAAQEPIPVKDRYEKQRDKLTRDLGKLASRKEQFARLLGDTRIERYMFMVPFFDSHELVQHAAEKSREFRNLQLPYLHEDFQVVVVDEDAYADVREEVLKRPRPLIEVGDHTLEEVAAWIQANGPVVSIAENKLRGILAESPRRMQVIEGLVMQYIKGENALGEMRRRYPDNWELTTRYRNHKEQLLIFEYPSDSIAFNSLSAIAKEIAEELEGEVPALAADPRLRSALAWSSIAGWIMRCPLSFPSVAS
ncbi:hypothetical protein [Streptomyces xanthophaeus]